MKNMIVGNSMIQVEFRPITFLDLNLFKARPISFLHLQFFLNHIFINISVFGGNYVS